MIEGKTKSGFEFAISEEVLDDFKTFKYLQKVDRGDISYMMDAMVRVLGEEQEEALEAHMLKVNGDIKTSDMFSEFKEILESTKTGKNS